MVVLNSVIIVAVLATLAALVLGLFSMARGGAFNERYGNRLMRLRVLIQGLAIVMLVIAMLMSLS
ncbi:MAG: twin transmembrane helix small protein [Alphaproteobacteria bacterium]|nr:twin transmembrane helix small protein [Alphaproteobacteria bacterium]